MSCLACRYILWEAEEHGLLLPYACRMGCCTACAVRVLQGDLYQPQARPSRPCAARLSFSLITRCCAVLLPAFPSLPGAVLCHCLLGEDAVATSQRRASPAAVVGLVHPNLALAGAPVPVLRSVAVIFLLWCAAKGSAVHGIMREPREAGCAHMHGLPAHQSGAGDVGRGRAGDHMLRG